MGLSWQRWVLADKALSYRTTLCCHFHQGLGTFQGLHYLDPPAPFRQSCHFARGAQSQGPRPMQGRCWFPRQILLGQHLQVSRRTVAHDCSPSRMETRVVWWSRWY